MLFEYEIVEHQEGLPIRSYFVHVGQIKVHWHKDIELMLVLKGSVLLNRGNKTEIVTSGEIRILNCYETHFLHETDEENIVLGIHIDEDLTKNILYPLSRIFIDDAKYNHVKVREISSNMCQLVESIDLDNPLSKLAIMGKTYDLLYSIINSDAVSIRAEETLRRMESDFERLDRFIKYINENYSERLNLEGVAQQLYISRYHLSHFVKKQLGINFQSFLILIRLQHAYELIVATNKKMIEIASDCGFSDVKYMTKIVKEKYKMTPSELRKSLITKQTSSIMDKKGHKPFDLEAAYQLLRTYK